MKRLLAILVLLVGCKGGGHGFKADGSVSLDGKPRTVKECRAEGKTAELTVRLGLDDGSVVAIPVQGGAPTVTPPGKAKIDLTDCDKHAMSGSGSEGHYKGELGIVCKGNGAALDLTLSVDCS